MPQNQTTTLTRPLVHFETSPRARITQRLGQEQIMEVMSGVPGLAESADFSFNMDPEQSDRHLANAEVLVTTGPVDFSDLERRAPRLKWVQLMSAGVEAAVGRIPDGVSLTNVRGVHSARAGEFGITALLMLNNRIPTYATLQRAGTWKQMPASAIRGKTVSIFGMGALGGAVAQWAKTMEMRVLGVTRTGKPHEHADEVLTLTRKDEALHQSDFVVITLPLTDETRGCIGRRELDLLPSHAGLVNIGRAPVLDHEALIAKLRDGSLSGAVLDVFPQEPLPEDSEFWNVPNLFVTPHSGLDEPDVFGQRCLEVFAHNLAAYCKGEPLRTLVDTKAGY